MYRTHNCGELRLSNVGESVRLAGWIQRIRDKGGMLWIDLRDRYGLTQLIFNEDQTAVELFRQARSTGREYVIQVDGLVIERVSKNSKLPTGEVEIAVKAMSVLSSSETPPFTIETETDGGEDLRMKYRYLDLRRHPMQTHMKLRHRLMQLIRRYLDEIDFLEIETPYLIKSTPEGARDFVVPSRMNPGQFYALPQSPQTFKQLLMVSGMDRYFQIVRCFRDEDLRADRQPEFTQLDCEMAFVEQEDVLQTFEMLIQGVYQELKSVALGSFPRMTYAEAMDKYGSDKPDLRFEMPFVHLNELVQGHGFQVFDAAETVVGICVKGAANYSRKQLDALTEFVKKPQVGARGLVYVKWTEDQIKSSLDKFYSAEALHQWMNKANATPGDLLLVLAGERSSTLSAMNNLRLHMGDELGLRDPEKVAPLWVVDFPLLEWDEETQRFYAMHHPFTAPKNDDIALLASNPGKVRANAYDLVINGVEIGGGSIRIHEARLQQQMFDHLGFTKQEAEEQFGFLMGAFKYGAPPHGGIALGFDRLCAQLAGKENIREFIAFPKNNAGRDVMIEAPAAISESQLNELGLEVHSSKKV